jgi:uncharacterized 2Fe-2S/4Fe-4S cluster protein (DUF4445 family)
MLGKEVLVRFQPSGRQAYVLSGTRLVEAAAEAGVVLEIPCGGEGLCGRCRGLVLSGAADPTAVERDWLSDGELRAGWRLACQSTVAGPATIELPDANKNLQISKAPNHQISETAAGPHPNPLPAGEGTDYVAAVDIGTTTLVATLLDVRSGCEQAVEARLNPQTRFGDDVLSRILYSRNGSEQLRQLHETVVRAIDEMIGDLCAQVGVLRERIGAIALAGNTAMQQMLRGVDSSALGEYPFRPATFESVEFAAESIGLHIHPQGRCYVMPVIGGFVGGDTTAGMLATGIADSQGPTLLIDIGTNGEIVLFSDGKLRAASAAAGPAFEGARISRGMRGCTGAIEKVIVEDGRLRVNVIGNVSPQGLCGSGLIDAAAELLRHGLLLPQGRLLSPDQLPADVPSDLAARITSCVGRPAFLLATAEETGAEPIALLQRDLRELQLAAGAIRAGIVILLRQAGLKPTDLHHVLIGGGFGNFIRRSNAQRIGLLPHEIEHQRIRYMGNTSLAGASMAALSTEAKRRAESLAARTEHVDLSKDPKFHDVFAESMLFPET